MLAGFTGTAILGEMHAFRARDPRVDDIGEGMSPLQVALSLCFVQQFIFKFYRMLFCFILRRKLPTLFTNLVHFVL